MEVPRLVITYPGPEDPGFGTATTPYDIEALKAWAEQVTAFLEDANRRLLPRVVSGFEAPLPEPEAPEPEAPAPSRPARFRGARAAPTSGGDDPGA